jgi:hypothetical protein
MYLCASGWVFVFLSFYGLWVYCTFNYRYSVSTLSTCNPIRVLPCKWILMSLCVVFVVGRASDLYCLVYWHLFDLLTSVCFTDICLFYWHLFGLLTSVCFTDICLVYWHLFGLLTSVWFSDICLFYWHLFVLLTSVCFTDICLFYWHLFVLPTSVCFTDICLFYWHLFVLLTSVCFTDICLVYWHLFGLLTSVWFTDICLVYWHLFVLLTSVWFTDICLVYWHLFVLLTSVFSLNYISMSLCLPGHAGRPTLTSAVRTVTAACCPRACRHLLRIWLSLWQMTVRNRCVLLDMLLHFGKNGCATVPVGNMFQDLLWLREPRIIPNTIYNMICM